MNKKVQEWLRSQRVYFFPLNPPQKGAMVERFHRTLWGLINRYQRLNNTERFVHVLDDLLHNYNHKKHSTIKMAPVDVTEENQDEVYARVRAKGDKIKVKPPKLADGDYVRITRERGRFEKETTARYTLEIFKVKRILWTEPITYKLEDLLGEEIAGSFYAEEVIKTKMPEVFKIRDVLDERWTGRGRNRRKELLVSWVGWPATHNSWIAETDVVDL
jgi:hypothetical protein